MHKYSTNKTYIMYTYIPLPLKFVESEQASVARKLDRIQGRQKTI